MHRSRGNVLGGLLVTVVLAAGCSSSTSSQGVVSTTTAAPAASSSEPSADTTPPPDSTEASGGAETSAPVPAGGVVEGGSLVVGLDGEPPTLDPAGNSSSLSNGTIYDGVYDTLLRFDIDANVNPWLVESYTEADDRLSWTLTLRQDVAFHDGTPFNAEAVKFNLERQQVSLYNAPSVQLITTVEVIDEFTVKVNLSQPWTAFPNAIASPVVGSMVSPTAGAGGADALLRNPVGTGPYQFVEWVPGDRIVVERNESYWGEPSPLDEIVFKLLPIEASRVAAFEAGELDAMLSTTDDTAEKERNKGVQVVRPPSTGYGFSFFNQTRPPFDDVRVRQALQLGVDRDALAGAYDVDYAYDVSSGTPFVKDSEWWKAPAEPLRFDPEQARALLADYGQPIDLTYLVLAGNQNNEDLIRATVEYWTELGVTAEVEIIPDLSTYVGRVISGDFDVAGWIGNSFGDPNSVTFYVLHSTGSNNYGKYSDPEMDALLEEARRENDPARRHELYDQVQDLFRADVPYLMGAHGAIYVIADDDVGGLGDSIFFPTRTAGFLG